MDGDNHENDVGFESCVAGGVVALPAGISAASAKGDEEPLPPGACAFEKKGVIATSTICSYQCNADDDVVLAAAVRERRH